MDRLIKDVFEDECGHLVANSALVKRLHDYQLGFVNKNSDHIDFFGGYLTGVQTVRFTDADRDRWFSEILECDETQLEDRLIKLPAVNPEFNVSSDAMNLSCAWMLHFLYHGQKLSSKEKEQAMLDVMLVWQYKYLTSRLYRHFQYPADRAIAEAAYVSLSGKFDLKRYGSWGATLHARAERIIEPSSIYHSTIDKMDNDYAVIRMVNDIQGKIREMLKLLYRAFLDAHERGNRVTSTSSVVEHDGLEILKDKTKTYRAYLQYIYSVVTDEGSFIKEELVVVIEKMMHTMPPRLFRETLVWMSKNFRQSHSSEIEKVLHDTLIHCFGYLNDNRSVVKSHSDLPGILGNLKGIYASSRSSDPTLISLRELTEKMVKKATNNRNSTIIAAVRSGVLLYIVARAMTMRHYSSSLG